MKRGQIRSHTEHLLRADQVAKATEQAESAILCFTCGPANVCRCRFEWRGPHGAKRDRSAVTPERPLRVTIGDLLRSKQ